MKKTFLSLFALVLILSLFACDKKPVQKDEGKNPPENIEASVEDSIEKEEESAPDPVLPSETPDPVPNAPVSDEPVENVPDENTPVDSVPDDDTPNENTPVEDTPVESVPEEDVVEEPKKPSTPQIKPEPEQEEEKPLDHNDYWPLQAAYNEALKTTTLDDDIKASEDILSLYKNLEDLDSCRRVIVPILKISKIYEERGQFADALRCYRMYRDAYLYIDEHTDENCTEPLKYADAFITHYSYIEPVVYTTAKNPADVPYYGAKNEPRVGTYTGMCGVYDENISNAFLLYVQFGTETIYSFSYKLPKDTTDYMLELAWNTSDHTIEGFKKIADGEYDEYIKENLEWLGGLEDCKILLRFGAEVNEWEVNTTYAKNGKLEEFKKQYIAAFRRVSELRRQYAPDVAMVYSPNDISNMYVTHLDFYPGDEWVDWVGMSSYMNISSAALGTWGSMTDAYYSRGMYANQILKMKAIIDDFGGRKPIVISECGFCYSSEKSSQTQAHAAEKLKLFYSYVNMVFPQVKAVFYFNTNFNGNSYQLYNADGSSANSNSSIYTDMMKTNLPISSLRNGGAEGYTRITTLNEKRDVLNLALFASYPGNPQIKVTYSWDGKKICETSTSPYHASIEKPDLTAGTHTLTVVTECKKTTFTKNYTVSVLADGTVTVD